MTHLSVNLNAIAMLRNRRDVPWPSVTGMGRIALEAGAHGLTVHPRPDERHIRRTDVAELAELLQDFPGREFNIEGYPSGDFLDLVARTRPDQVTFVPDDPSQSTSDHGWPIAESRAILEPAIGRMRELGIRVSLFVDADPSAPAEAAMLGADRIELYTGPFGAASDPEIITSELAALKSTADSARLAGRNSHPGVPGLGVNAGHDLNLVSLPLLREAIPDLAEVSIGHALTADSLIYGMAESVRRYRAACG
ncbi:pyridoxine 5'-phosphate synthase [Devosia sp.]|uniref:pyridoxine 5'-phosphate synthase n=1 Tax=Devosia sp. TaxID=1871048 RepID=UPI003A948B47